MARGLFRGLRAMGWPVVLVAGSRGAVEPEADARAFYGEVQAVDFGPALTSSDPIRFDGPPGTAPLHPSFEDRPGALDIAFAKLDELDYERHVRAWSRELERAGAGRADVLHLHHLTPLNEAAERVAAGVPVVGHMHGTELLMLERIAAGAPPEWRHAEQWAARMRLWASRCARLLVVPAGVDRAIELLDVPRQRIVTLPGGVDADLFSPRDVDREQFWRRVLVDQPRGWLAGQAPGSVGYRAADVARLAGGMVLVYPGRFTAVKRLDLLIEAFGQARERVGVPVGLVLVGGHPGEWEGEHPAQIAARLGVRDVFLAGWQSQDELPEFFAAADAVILASEREQFGQVLIEGMACGLPAIARRSLGPTSIVEDGRTGWLVSPDGPDPLARAIVEAVADPAERRRRGELARRSVCERFAWSSVTARFAGVLADVADAGGPSARGAVAPSPS